MLSISQTFGRAFDTMKKRNWEKIFVLVDIHDTIIKSDYCIDIQNPQFYPNALEVLEMLTFRKDVSLILWSSCTTEKLKEYQIEFIKHGHVIFDHFNYNPEVQSTEYACFADKPYFNVIIDDKAGFDAENDWTELLDYLKLI